MLLSTQGNANGCSCGKRLPVCTTHQNAKFTNSWRPVAACTIVIKLPPLRSLKLLPPSKHDQVHRSRIYRQRKYPLVASSLARHVAWLHTQPPPWHGSYRNLRMKSNDFSMTFQKPFLSSNGGNYPGKKVTKCTRIYQASLDYIFLCVLL